MILDFFGSFEFILPDSFSMWFTATGNRGRPYKMAGKKKGEINNPMSPSKDKMRIRFKLKARSEKCILKVWIISKI
jgi:hypothetical protein